MFTTADRLTIFTEQRVEHGDVLPGFSLGLRERFAELAMVAELAMA